MVLRAGQQVGSYRIISEIAHGEYAYVYKATHIVLTNRIVAFKLLHTTFQNAPDGKDLFFQEARILEHLKHPAILPVLDVNMHEGFPYIVKEFAAHGTLRDRIRHQRSQPITQEEALYLLQQIGDVIQYVHEQNIVHCDLKPENILFTAENELRLTDFDIARVLHKSASQSAGIGGSPSYMSPEQFQGKVRRESDQYALGCIAYELLTGQRPFTGRDFETLKNAQSTQEPLPLSAHNPGIPTHIEQAVLQALAKKYADRHTDVATFIQALQAEQKQAAPMSYPDTTQRHWSEQTQQHPQQHTPQLILKNNPHPTRIEDDIYYEPTVAMENEVLPEQARPKKNSSPKNQPSNRDLPPNLVQHRQQGRVNRRSPNPHM